MANRTGQGTPIVEMNSQVQVSGSAPSVRNATTGPAARNAGEPWEAMARSFHQVSSRMEDRLDVAAEEDGRLEGIRQGMRADVQLKRDATIRGRAFDASATRTMIARHDTESRAAAEEIFAKNKENPAGLEKQLNAYKAGLDASNMPDEVKAEVGLSLDRMKIGYISEATRAAEARQRDADRASSLLALDTKRKSIERLARLADNDEEAAAALALEVEGLKTFMLERGPKGGFEFDGKQYGPDASRAGIYDLEDIQKSLISTADTAKEARLIGKFMQMDSIGEKEVFLKKFEDEFADGANDLDLDQFDRLSSRMRGDIGRMSADVRGEVSLIGKQASAMETMIEKGYNPGEDNMLQLEQRAALSGDEMTLAEVRQVRALADFQNEARAWQPAQLQSWINSERSRINAASDVYGAGAQEIGRVELAEKLLSNMNTELARDPLSWAARVGVTPVTPLKLDDGESYQRRLKEATIVSEHYGTPMQLMTDEETLQWKNAWDVAPPDGRVKLMAALQDGFGTDAIAAFEDLGKTSAGIANAGGLLVASPAHVSTARDFAIGDAALANPGNKILPAGKKITEARTAAMGNAFGTASQTMMAVTDTADRLYAAEALRKGLNADNFDEQLYEKSLQRAAGQYQERDGTLRGGIVEQKAGHKIVLPIGMSETEFTNLLGGAKPADLFRGSVGGNAPMHKNGLPLNERDFSRSYLVSSGPGRYFVSTTNPFKGEPTFLLDPGNAMGLYELDISKLKGGGQ